MIKVLSSSEAVDQREEVAARSNEVIADAEGLPGRIAVKKLSRRRDLTKGS